MVRHQAGVDTRLHGEDHAQGQLRPIVAGGTPQRGQAVRVASAGECRGQPDAAPQIGLAVAGDLDPTLVRLAIVLGCLTGWGILAYFIAWAVIPEENPKRRTAVARSGA